MTLEKEMSAAYALLAKLPLEKLPAGAVKQAAYTVSNALREAELAAESRGAKARDAEWREAVNQYLNALTCHAGLSELAGASEPLHALMGNDAQRPPDSPSVLAAQPKDQANQGRAAAQAVEPQGETCACGTVMDLHAKIASHTTLDGVMHTTAGCAPGRPRAAPTPALPREAPEPGGAGLCPGCDCIRGQCDCEGCPKGPEPHEVGTLPWTHLICGVCETDLYGEDGILVLSEVADCPKCKPLRDRLGSVEPRAAPSDSAPATPGLGPPARDGEDLLSACPRPGCGGSLVAQISTDETAWEADRCRKCGSRWWHDPPLSPADLDRLRRASGEPRVAPSASPDSPSQGERKQQLLEGPAALAEQLRDALRALMALIEDGTLVRDVSRDHEAGWALRSVRLVGVLSAANDLLSDKPPARPSRPSSASLESGGGTLDTNNSNAEGGASPAPQSEAK